MEAVVGKGGTNMTRETSTTRPIRILVVDDDRLILATLGSGLRHAGYDTLEASSGKDAVRIAEAEHPDLAILDVRMPGMGGVETARAINERTVVPFMFLSAYSDADVVRLAAEEGALGYLVKPMDVAQIVPAIEAALARAAELRKLRDQEVRLSRALGTGRDTATAVGIIMERYRLDRQSAFEALRFHARSQRRKLEDVAGELVHAAETTNLPAEALAHAVRR
jgi:response regulator NasT